MPALVIPGIAVVVVVLVVTVWLAAAALADGATCGALVTEPPEPHATSEVTTSKAPIVVIGARKRCGTEALSPLDGLRTQVCVQRCAAFAHRFKSTSNAPACINQVSE